MQAQVGDRLHVFGRQVGNPGKTGEIIEVRGERGSPPYVVRFDDGHEALVFPGPDAVVEQAGRSGGGS
ncbi:MAG TPA: DUF1918 domain-containing protein [Actinopolymorphaceae bacterium]